MDFFGKLEGMAKDKGSCLCVGLDPRIDPACPSPRQALVSANRRLVEATEAFTACYKPNLAFYEAFGAEGAAALAETMALIPPDIPVILDAKRCDIDSTAEAYASALFGRLGAAAVTLSPYIGRDAVDPFLKYPDRCVFILCRTSNPGAGVFQDLQLSMPGSPPSALYLKVASECCSWSKRVGLVVAGNDLEALRAVRTTAPEAWFLSPGIGFQGGKADEAIAAGSRKDGLGVLVVAARSVADAPDPGLAAKKLRDEIEAARKRILEPSTVAATGFGPGQALKRRLFTALIDTGCFKLGDFVLKSGKKSPFYIDLRRLVSDPKAMELAAQAYAELAAGLAFDRIAGIPAAALSLATAASLKTGKPMIWPRMPAKDHGTGNRIEGAFERGEIALLLDDLITTGASKIEAIGILRGEGLVVTDLAVLIERGKQGRRDMETAGLQLRAFAHVRELFAVCSELGLIDEVRRRELETFVDAE
jgi:uridine monophosphate synthetase